jgi:hypothetical protein
MKDELDAIRMALEKIEARNVELERRLNDANTEIDNWYNHARNWAQKDAEIEQLKIQLKEHEDFYARAVQERAKARARITELEAREVTGSLIRIKHTDWAMRSSDPRRWEDFIADEINAALRSEEVDRGSEARFRPQCRWCGRFVKHDDDPNVRAVFTPDTHLTSESTEWEHADCKTPEDSDDS